MRRLRVGGLGIVARGGTIALACVIALSACTAISGSDANVAHSFVPAVRGSLQDTVVASGTLGYTRQATLTFGEAGTVESVAAQVGQSVRSGAVLASLHLESLRRAVRASENALAAAHTTLDAVRGTGAKLSLSLADQAVAQARVDLNAAESASERARSPFSVVDQAEAAERLASARVELIDAAGKRDTIATSGTDSDLARAEANVDAARNAVDAAKGATPIADNSTAQGLSVAESVVADAERAYRNAVRRTYGVGLVAGAPIPAPSELRFEDVTSSDELVGGAALPTETAVLFRSRGIEWPPGGGASAPQSVGETEGAEDVKAGWRDVIAARARLNDAQLDAARSAAKSSDALASAEAELARAEEELAQIAAGPASELVALTDARLELTQARVDEARRELAEIERGPNPDEIALMQAQVATATISLEAATIERDRLRAEGAEGQSAEAEAAVVDAGVRLGRANQRLRGAVLVAPFDGIVADVRVAPGGQGDPGSPAVVVVDPTGLAVKASVDQIDIVRIQQGQRTLVSIESASAIAEGVVQSVALLPVVSQGLTTYEVSIDLGEATGALASLRAGLSVLIHIVVDEVDDVVIVPANAILLAGRETVVRTLDAEGALRDRPVYLGVNNGLWVQVIDGVAEGDRVLVNDAQAGNDTLIEALGPSSRGQVPGVLGAGRAR